MTKTNSYSREEVVLCIYAARFDMEDFGGIGAIHSLALRSESSIRLKILNIASMCDEEGISRVSENRSLSGLPKGESGRRTNWDLLSEYSTKTREQHLEECVQIIEGKSALPDELQSLGNHREGARKRVWVNSYERDSSARASCIRHYGPTCSICGFNFKDEFGSLAEGFIHVHHLVPLAEVGEEYIVDPVEDLRPVCPNCHAIIHLGGVVRSIPEVQALLKSSC